MIVETDILRGNERLHQRGRQFGVVDHHAVFTVIVPRSHDLSIGRIDLRGEAVYRVLQVLNRRHVTYPSFVYRIESKYGSQHRYCQ